MSPAFDRILDCHTLDSTLASLADASGIEVGLLSEALRGFAAPPLGEEPPHVVNSREALATLGVRIEELRFDAHYYFHGTRIVPPESFSQEGILPLLGSLDRLWTLLYELAADSVGASEWDQFRAKLGRGGYGQDGWLYHLRTTEGPIHGGPCGSLLRDVVVSPASHHHDYLDCPEIRILRRYGRRCGADGGARASGSSWISRSLS
jgi:hypothetical protein